MILKSLPLLLLICFENLIVFCQPTLQDRVMASFEKLPFPPEYDNNKEGEILREALLNFNQPIKELYHPGKDIFVGTVEGKLYLRKPNQEKKNIL